MSTKHLTYLDSLRGLAALTVVFSHFTVLFWVKSKGIPQAYALGELAVCLFFVLSGFVLSQRFLGVEGMKWPLIEAVIKRPFRLLGVVWATVILGILVSTLVHGISISQYGKTWLQFVIDFFISPFSTGADYNGVLWTIRWELWGSMLVFAILLGCNNFPRYLRMLIFSVILILNLHSYYGMFLFGMIIADLHKNFYCGILVRYRNLLSAVMVLITIGAGYLFYNQPVQAVAAAYIKNGLMTLVTVEIFIIAMLNTVGFRTVLNWQPVNFLGNISYSFYAIHYLIMKTICESVNTLLEQHMSRDIAWFGMVAISLPVIVFTAWMLDKYVDKVSIRLAAKIAQWAVSIITLEVAMRGPELKLIVMLRIPSNLLRLFLNRRKNISSIINGTMQLCVIRNNQIKR
ncbi:MAG: acyltransferase [Victivallaceae bacterium]|jgi:peptidoglycan/LPS O-acetylase OafA/YrhL